VGSSIRVAALVAGALTLAGCGSFAPAAERAAGHDAVDAASAPPADVGFGRHIPAQGSAGASRRSGQRRGLAGEPPAEAGGWGLAEGDMLLADRGGGDRGGGGGNGGGGNGGGGNGAGGQAGDAADADADERAGGTAVEPGRSRPLLIYQADLTLAVFEVASTQDRVVALAKRLGGFLSARDDRRVVIRIPAGRFEDALEGVSGLGDVLHEDVQALDVTEEFRDLTVRLRNAEVVRERLEELLEKADDVEDALAVQRELGKVTETIERIKGRLRFLEDRLAYSTITVRFQPRRTETIDRRDAFRLPFPWLDELGLGTLLDLR